MGPRQGATKLPKSFLSPKEQVLLESEYTRDPQVVESGTVLILFPGVWHRYTFRDSAVGWTEHWLECQGPAFDEALRTGIVQPTQPLLHTGLEPDLLRCFERCHTLRGSGRAGQPAPHIDDGVFTFSR